MMKIPAEALVAITADKLTPGDFACSEHGFWLLAIKDPEADAVLLAHLSEDGSGLKDRVGKAFAPGKFRVLRMANKYELTPQFDLEHLSWNFPKPGSLVLDTKPQIYTFRPNGWGGIGIWACMTGQSTTETPHLNSQYIPSASAWSMHLKYPDGRIEKEPLFLVESAKEDEIA